MMRRRSLIRAMFRCPSCSSTFVRPVRPTWWQVLRVRFTRKRPVSCWHCDWRGWVVPEEDPLPPEPRVPQVEDRPAPPAPPAPPDDKRPGSRFFAASVDPTQSAVAGSPQRR
jgi:hypothetical protein